MELNDLDITNYLNQEKEALVRGSYLVDINQLYAGFYKSSN